MCKTYLPKQASSLVVSLRRRPCGGQQYPLLEKSSIDDAKCINKLLSLKQTSIATEVKFLEQLPKRRKRLREYKKPPTLGVFVRQCVPAHHCCIARLSGADCWLQGGGGYA